MMAGPLRRHQETDVIAPATEGCVDSPMLRTVRDRPTDWLLAALDRVIAGHTVVDPEVADSLVHAATHGRRIDGPFGLTRQEEQVLARLQPRRTNHDIGSTLGISPNTVKTHLAAAFRKLGVHDRDEAAMFAATHGLA